MYEPCVTVWHALGKLNTLHDAVVKGHESDTEAVKTTFAKYDTDSNGSLDMPELARVATELGTELTKNELVAIFTLLDADKVRGVWSK